MRARRCLWIVAGGLCALGVAIGYLARPVDELAALKRLRPQIDAHDPPDPIYGVKGSTAFEFVAPYSAILASIPGHITRAHPSGTDVELPGGRQAVLIGTIPDSPTGRWGDNCILFLLDDDRPWYQKAWSSIKSRLGL